MSTRKWKHTGIEKMISIQDALRSQHTQRWILLNTCKTQSIAEHQFNTALIVRALVADFDLGSTDRDELVHLAMVHDLDEVITGDTPSITKDRYRSLGFDPNSVTIGWDLEPREPWDKMVIKIADLMEAVWWLGEHKVGRHARTVWLIMQGHLEARFEELIRLQPDVGLAARRVWKDMTTGGFTIEQ